LNSKQIESSNFGKSRRISLISKTPTFLSHEHFFYILDDYTNPACILLIKEKGKFESLKNYFTKKRNEIKNERRNIFIEEMDFVFTLYFL